MEEEIKKIKEKNAIKSIGFLRTEEDCGFDKHKIIIELYWPIPAIGYGAKQIRKLLKEWDVPLENVPADFSPVSPSLIQCPNCGSEKVTNWVNHNPVDGACIDCGFEWKFGTKK